jgi:hypothetical protein
MAVLAAEVGHLQEKGSDPSFDDTKGLTPFFDLDRYFIDREAHGPWLQWARGTRSAWLRVRRVIDVVPVSLANLTPMPSLLRSQGRTRAFLAAGVRDNEVFLFLDPARLT